MSLFVTVRDGIEYPFEQAWEHIKPVVVDELAPSLKSFLLLFSTDEGKFILQTAIAYAPKLLEGPFGAVAAEIASVVIAGSIAIAKQDASITLQQVQSALQIAKVAQNIQTPSDTALAASVAVNNPDGPNSAETTPAA